MNNLLCVMFLLIVLGAVFLFGCGESVSYVDTIPKELPEFRVQDVDGNEISNESINSGYAFIFIPVENESANNIVLNVVDDFETNEGLFIKKVCFSGDIASKKADWISIVNDDLKDVFVSRYPNCFLILFDDNSFIGGLTTDESSAFMVEKVFVLKGLYKFIFNYSSSEEVIKSHRPEGIVDPYELLNLYAAVLEDSLYQYILFINKPDIWCGDSNILKYFDHAINTIVDAKGLILFDNSYSVTDINSLIVNFSVSVPVFRCSDNINDRLEELSDLNYTNKYKFLFVYRSHEFISSYYILRDCNVLYQNLQ